MTDLEIQLQGELQDMRNQNHGLWLRLDDVMDTVARMEADIKSKEREIIVLQEESVYRGRELHRLRCERGPA